jgi:hypothetical protein
MRSLACFNQAAFKPQLQCRPLVRQAGNLSDAWAGPQQAGSRLNEYPAVRELLLENLLAGGG